MSDTTGPGGATHVGIDVSKERLDVCFIPEGEHSYQRANTSSSPTTRQVSNPSSIGSSRHARRWSSSKQAVVTSAPRRLP